MPIEIEQFMCGSDNFGVLVHDPAGGHTVLIDAPEEAPILAAIERTGWRPTHILITHHHGDHVKANLALKERYGLEIVGPEAEADRIPGIDRTVSEGDTLQLCGDAVEVIETPGHTSGHVVYHFSGNGVLFAGDTLFSMGCGRLFEGSPSDMYGALEKLKALPANTTIYCGHEYTDSNAKFARSIDPDNVALRQRAAQVTRLREEGRPTLPTTLAEEMLTNPFLRTDDNAIRSNLELEDVSDEVVFSEIRRLKDAF